MKRMITFVLALALVTVGMPALAHNAAYPGECDERSGNDRCERNDDTKPAHSHCTGVRNHMWTDDGLVSEKIGFAFTQDASVKAYIQSTDGSHQASADDPLRPGLIWLETNGFSGLQRAGFECMSDDHDNPNEWEGHADKVLI